MNLSKHNFNVSSSCNTFKLIESDLSQVFMKLFDLIAKSTILQG